MIRRTIDKLKTILYMLVFKLGIDSEKSYIELAKNIPGWVNDAELTAKEKVSFNLPDNAIIVEIGAFLGRSTIVTAGARKLRGSGVVHVVDPFDGSGDEFSIPIYKRIESELDLSLKEQFLANIRKARLQEFVIVHVETAETLAQKWSLPIDMLILDGDQSVDGARRAYDKWFPFLKPGGVLILHNSGERQYEKEHDGHRRIVIESIKPPDFSNSYCIRMTTFAIKN